MDPVWEELHAAKPWGRYPSEPLIIKAMQTFTDRRTREQTEVMELGCGAGANLFFFLREGFQVTGVDGSESAIKKAQAYLEPFKSPSQKLDLQVVRFDALDFSDGSFHMIVDYFAIYANPVAEIHETYKNVWAMLKPGGRFYTRVWGTKCTGADTGRQIEPGTSENPETGPCQDMGVSHFFHLEELQDLFGRWSNKVISRTEKTVIGTDGMIIEEWEVWAQK